MVVGRDVVIGRGATLVGDTMVGSECWVRPGATIKRTILLPGSSVGKGAHLEDCIVGHGYDVRAGERIRGVTLVRGAARSGASQRLRAVHYAVCVKRGRSNPTQPGLQVGGVLNR
jgi:NDP-sugar pyrophosphorylase family protein